MSLPAPTEGLLTAAHCCGDVRGEKPCSSGPQEEDHCNRQGGRDVLWGVLSAELGEVTRAGPARFQAGLTETTQPNHTDKDSGSEERPAISLCLPRLSVLHQSKGHDDSTWNSSVLLQKPSIRRGSSRKF